MLIAPAPPAGGHGKPLDVQLGALGCRADPVGGNAEVSADGGDEAALGVDLPHVASDLQRGRAAAGGGPHLGFEPGVLEHDARRCVLAQEVLNGVRLDGAQLGQHAGVEAARPVLAPGSIRRR